MGFTTRDVTRADVYRLLEDIREEDRREWQAAIGGDLTENLMYTIEQPGSIARVIYRHGYQPEHLQTPSLIWGVLPLSNDVGQVWLVGTNVGMSHVRQLHATITDELPLMDRRFKVTIGWADKRNKLHWKWMEKMGYRLVREAPIGLAQEPFLKYERSAYVRSDVDGVGSVWTGDGPGQRRGQCG